MKQYKINKPTTKLVKSTLALILGMFIAYNLDNEVFATNYSVTYHDNFVSNMPVDENSATLSPSVTLPATTPTRDGFQFKGWCTTLTADGGTCSGTSYAAGGTYTINQVASNDLTLYAVWGPPLYMQDATSADCGKTMYDNRGDGTYKKIGYSTVEINDLCWMTRNLDLPGGTTITSSDSNITADSYILPNSSTTGFNSDSGQFVYNSDSTSCGNNSPCYSYYSYATATAGTNSSSGAAASDVCPYGWRLPTESEYSSLASSYNTGAKLTESPFFGVYAGYYSHGSLYSGIGVYWSSTAGGSNYAYYLSFDNSNALVDIDYKRYGYSIRCVMKNS